MFNEVHPRITRSRVPVELAAGINAKPAALPEEDYLRCTRCGFVLNRSRHPVGYGDGITQAATSNYEYDSDLPYDEEASPGATGDPDVDYDGGNVISDPTAASGCPLCGSFMYE